MFNVARIAWRFDAFERTAAHVGGEDDVVDVHGTGAAGSIGSTLPARPPRNTL
jgi:hypothetical protein